MIPEEASKKGNRIYRAVLLESVCANHWRICSNAGLGWAHECLPLTRSLGMPQAASPGSTLWTARLTAGRAPEGCQGWECWRALECPRGLGEDGFEEQSKSKDVCPPPTPCSMRSDLTTKLWEPLMVQHPHFTYEDAGTQHVVRLDYWPSWEYSTANTAMTPTLQSVSKH